MNKKVRPGFCYFTRDESDDRIMRCKPNRKLVTLFMRNRMCDGIWTKVCASSYWTASYFNYVSPGYKTVQKCQQAHIEEFL